MNTKGCFDLPLSLLISVKDRVQQDYATKNILNFYNLLEGMSEEPQHRTHSRLEKESIQFLTKHLNFIRFSNNYHTPTLNCQQYMEQTVVPSFSCILITNSSLISAPNSKQNDLNPLSRADWSYHHKIDLNDPNGKLFLSNSVIVTILEQKFLF